MSDDARRPRLPSAGRIAALALAALAAGAAPEKPGGPPGPAPVDHPIVAGFERFGADPKLGPVPAGQLLLGELNCTSCHKAEAAAAAYLDRKQAPILDGVGARVRVGHLRDFLADPHATKPGTTMPDLLAGLPAGERREAAEALVHFLATTGRTAEKNPQAKAVAPGRTLYQQSGCLACHGPREGDEAPLATSVPLGDLAAKYTIPSLAAFLADPHKVRPSGRMPGMILSPEDAGSVASYLLRDLVANVRPNLEYRYFEGNWATLPDFSALKPKATGRCVDFDLGVAARKDTFGLQFRGHLRIDREGDYTFHLTSDDGSRLTLDDKVVVRNDGIHPAGESSGAVRLAAGMHRFVVDYFDGGGQTELGVEYEGPGLGRQEVGPALTLKPEAPKPADPAKSAEPAFSPDPALAAKGRGLFGSLGCASCHQLNDGGKPIESKVEAPGLAALRAGVGCLGPAAAKGVPRFGLDKAQRAALAAAIAALATPPAKAPAREAVVARTMLALNCYACHKRGDLGGVEPGRDRHFQTTQPEMGDEGRLPPTLDGVGGKLDPGFARLVFALGAKDRPYMHTRMPKFGAEAAGSLAADFEALDAPAIPAVPKVEFDQNDRRVVAAGRFIVGGQALNCVACHTFKGVKAQGIQAIDMTIMTRRLRRDWFFRYLPDPAALRPGTRMPAGWPMGQSMLPKVLDGDTPRQIEAVWRYLAYGDSAPLPYGLGRDPIPLVPGTEAILYRNFIEGAGPRGIGVGYPEKANLVFDAGDARLALIWQGAFLDASLHWVDRGAGFQAPMGDNVVILPRGPSFATLKDPAAAWPEAATPDPAIKFRGYRLGTAGKPTFLYDVGPVRVEDFPDAVPSKEVASIRRTLSLNSPAPVDNLWFRAAVADKVEPAADGWYALGNGLRMRFRGGGKPVVRSSNGKAELLVPIKYEGGKAKLVQEIDW